MSNEQWHTLTKKEKCDRLIDMILTADERTLDELPEHITEANQFYADRDAYVPDPTKQTREISGGKIRIVGKSIRPEFPIVPEDES